MNKRMTVMAPVLLLVVTLGTAATGFTAQCGGAGQECCTVGDLCQAGSTCIGSNPGSCEPCGESGLICCPSGRNRGCADGLGCFGADLGECQPCGELGEQCCPFLGQCVPNLACADTCVPAECWACTCADRSLGMTEFCSNTPVTVEECSPCPPDTLGPFATTSAMTCAELAPCEGKIRPDDGGDPGPSSQAAPALSSTALAGLVLLLVVVGTFALTRRVRT
jgi:hypothetical protein